MYQFIRWSWIWINVPSTTKRKIRIRNLSLLEDSIHRKASKESGFLYSSYWEIQLPMQSCQSLDVTTFLLWHNQSMVYQEVNQNQCTIVLTAPIPNTFLTCPTLHSINSRQPGRIPSRPRLRSWSISAMRYLHCSSMSPSSCTVLWE